MKALDIAFKDLLRSTRSAFTLVMMFIAPLLITGLIYLAFGGAGSSEASIHQIKLGIVNQDIAVSDVPVVLGNELVNVLTEPTFKDLLAVSDFPDETSARQAILDKEISVALIIPSDFTTTAMQSEANTTLVIFHDPASSLAPAIVQSIVGQYINSFNGSKIAAQVVIDRLTANGLKVDAMLSGQVVQSYVNWSVANVPDADGALPFVDLQTPVASTEGKSTMQAIAGVIMAGMIIYFVFYTGALNAQSIIREQDDQTLARLSVTPTSPATILVGKVIGSMIMITVQIVVLLLLSTLFFKIHWGDPVKTGIVCLVLVFLASGFGIFLMSFIKNQRQTGIILGGVLTVLGMLGGLFSGGFQNLPKAFEIANLLTPHGWAMRAFKIAIGEISGDMVTPVLVMLAIGAVSMLIGILLFRRRFN
jgi:ABC-2 type transport system permease protein